SIDRVPLRSDPRLVALRAAIWTRCFQRAGEGYLGGGLACPTADNAAGFLRSHASLTAATSCAPLSPRGARVRAHHPANVAVGSDSAVPSSGGGRLGRSSAIRVCSSAASSIDLRRATEPAPCAVRRPAPTVTRGRRLRAGLRL